ncbi:hypothetical protein CIP101434_01988 [Corynebacterium diphtheriae]|nr:hypothetical protein CIP101280_01795 [Corynebacterium diphtheriae]CAB0524288.1 hypothetical protein CIP101434_01988 [Corynebacterium diphtheriae]CAB0914096.1 hypothetical protein FRC0430_01831 [Corynebacterium diphtheriae]CAB0965710.1 hypothetical protein FRC0436_01832 [Corynebacterium diphtheriae]
MLYEYAGVVYPPRSKMCAARREHYVELLLQGLNFTQAAKVVGVSKRTGKVWRNGRTRSSESVRLFVCGGVFLYRLSTPWVRLLGV